mmetsp:Transcript_42901/g.107211  ORF Transcript_42901/g.107211 Transcript_42901/m.107211 type:complete len:127 (+) Transcript_42901:1898-2278(+)
MSAFIPSAGVGEWMNVGVGNARQTERPTAVRFFFLSWTGQLDTHTMIRLNGVWLHECDMHCTTVLVDMKDISQRPVSLKYVGMVGRNARKRKPTCYPGEKDTDRQTNIPSHGHARTDTEKTRQESK